MEACSTDIPRVRRGDLDFMPESEITVITKTTNALNDPIRLQMIYLLSQSDDLCTCEFEELLGLSQSKVSYHLNVLLQSRVITRENRGTWSHYRLRGLNLLPQVKALTEEIQGQADLMPE